MVLRAEICFKNTFLTSIIFLTGESLFFSRSQADGETGRFGSHFVHTIPSRLRLEMDARLILSRQKTGCQRCVIFGLWARFGDPDLGTEIIRYSHAHVMFY